MGELKQVIVVRADLKMSRGKLAAQAAHASVEAVMRILQSGVREWREWLDKWLREGQKKVVVRVESEEELLQVYREALQLGLPAALVEDAGRTELPPGTRTAVGIGPAPASIVDKVTGKLKLL
ncbi:MAG: peptidyl-tRNA hydrolase Pth2 [Thermoproteota archaeon]